MTDKPVDFVFDSSRIKWNSPEDRTAFEASSDEWADKIAQAVCEAKAQGMREAAEMVDNIYFRNPPEVYECADKIRAAADKIEGK